MFSTIRKGMFPFLVAFSALSVSASAAFYSVFGLSKLFAGASTEVIIMAGSLEVAKLVTASLLYQYWDTINKALKYYLSVAVIILILITSMGIYGFLSSAYQDTFNQLTYVDNEVEENNRKGVQVKRDIAVDSLRTYQRKILELDNNADVAGELGPLKYLSGLTGYPMDKIINVLLLVIIFVFDPLAVALVVAANFTFNQAYPKKKFKKNLYEEEVEVEGATLEEQAKYTNWEDEANVFDEYSEEDEKRWI